MAALFGSQLNGSPTSVIPAKAGLQAPYVIPAKAGIQGFEFWIPDQVRNDDYKMNWIPAFAGMT